jgi:protein TonB
MIYLRIVPAAILAAVVTLTLFLFMHKLISAGIDGGVQREAISGIRFGPVVIPDEILSRSRRKPPKPPTPKDPPPPPKLQLSPMDQQARDLPLMDIPRLDVPLAQGQGLFIGNYRQADQTAEGDIIPVVVIRPMYPREAAISGIQGWVKVEFTITETGTVKDPRVIDAKPPRVFNREAIRAILKWKFKPRVVEGIAVERRATQVIDFRLDES